MDVLEHPRLCSETQTAALPRMLLLGSDCSPNLYRAAPELLTALEDVLRCFDMKEGLSLRDEEAIKRGCAAVAKARA